MKSYWFVVYVVYGERDSAHSTFLEDDVNYFRYHQHIKTIEHRSNHSNDEITITNYKRATKEECDDYHDGFGF